MHLKSLVLKGFKSFADRSVLTLEPGITSVVGPNGSGKSNIADAVLWVLGERNVKSLRGQAMEDVIFSGSAARKSLGVAEVDLVLDNSDGTLPVDYDEVALTRRMYRSGESEYLINGAPARRMDFMDILHDTGLGAGTHSIISQGNLDAILSSKPEERRALIEEAAGVLKHKQRKDRSARKLAAMDDHLTRVKDVFAEMERQLKPLARKAQRAQTYQQTSEELSRLDLVLAVDDLRCLQGQWEAAATSEKEAAAQIDVERFQVKEAEERLEKLQLLLQEKGLYVGDLTAQRGRFHMVVERLESADKLLAEKGRSIASRLEQARTTLSSSSRRITSCSDQCAQLKESLEEQIAARDALLATSEELAAQMGEASAARTACDKELAELQAALKACEHEMNKAQAERGRLKDGLAGQISTRQVLQSKRADAREELNQARTSLELQSQGLDEEAKELEALLAQSRQATQEVSEAERALAAARAAQDTARKEKQRIEGNITALEELNRRMRAHNDASSWMVKHAQALDTKARPVSELIGAPPQLEAVVERLLGDDLTGFCAQDALSAKRMAQGLIESGKQGQASILIPQASAVGASDGDAGAFGGDAAVFAGVTGAGAGDTAGGIDAEGVSGRPERLLDQLSFPAELAGTLAVLLGDVVVAANLDEALGLGLTGVRIVCLDGAIVWPGVKIALATKASSDNGVLARERALAELRTRDEEAARALEQAAEAQARCDAELGRRRAMSLELSRTYAQRKGANDSAQAERARLANRVGTLEATLKRLEADIAKNEEKLTCVEPRIAELEASAEAARTERERIEAQVSELTGRRAVAYSKEQDLSGRLSTVKTEHAATKERVRFTSRELHERERDLERANHSKARAERELAVLEVAQGRILPLHELLADLKGAAQIWVDTLASKAALEQSTSASLSASINEARQATLVAKERLDAAQSALSEVRVIKGRLEVQVEGAVATIVDQCGVPLETALETPAPTDRAQVEGEVFKLRRRLSSMGTIDSAAAEEYAAAKERHAYMEAQIEDMEAARRALKRIVAAIDERMRVQFDATFTQVNANFQEIFGTLFPGGTASLSLVGEDDPDTMGVEMHAQPRGKKIAKMSLMSGGEKSLTALALLFAVYRIRRTPFYLLDEVEAALDDSNLRRLIAYLQTLRTHTQLIMITHQRRTMETSDVLYGVSMQADGVTKVVSQRLEAALPQVEEDGSRAE